MVGWSRARFERGRSPLESYVSPAADAPPSLFPSDLSCGMMLYHTGDRSMASVKVAITLDRETLARVDSLVSRRVFPNRSRAIQIALQEKLERQEGVRLAAECAKFDPAFEQAMAEEGLDLETWPDFKRRDSLGGSESDARHSHCRGLDQPTAKGGISSDLGDQCGGFAQTDMGEDKSNSHLVPGADRQATSVRPRARRRQGHRRFE